MKKLLVFLFIAVTGISTASAINGKSGKTISAHNGTAIQQITDENTEATKFKVIKLYDNGDMLARELSQVVDNTEIYAGREVIFMTKEKSFQKDEIIDVAAGKCLKIIGKCQFTNDGRAVNVVDIIDIAKR